MKRRDFAHLDVEIEHTRFVDGTQQIDILTGKPDADDVYHYICSALAELDDYRAVVKRAGTSPTTDEGAFHAVD